MLRGVADPFSPDGGMRLLTGNLGRAILKTSAVDEDRWTIEAPARIFDDQNQVIAAFKAGEIDRDTIVVVRFQGPRAHEIGRESYRERGWQFVSISVVPVSLKKQQSSHNNHIPTRNSLT